MNLPFTSRTATFAADDLPDVVARVLFEPAGTSFAISFDPEERPTILTTPIAPGQELQLAESLQFVADTIGATVPGRLSAFARGWTSVAADVHHTARSKGFWEDGVERNDGEMLCLVHSEISEVLEALRAGNPLDSKVPEFSGAEVELADAVIRIMDLAYARGWNVAGAIEAKMKYNANRPHKHGKEF